VRRAHGIWGKHHEIHVARAEGHRDIAERKIGGPVGNDGAQ